MDIIKTLSINNIKTQYNPNKNWEEILQQYKGNLSLHGKVINFLEKNNIVIDTILGKIVLPYVGNYKIGDSLDLKLKQTDKSILCILLQPDKKEISIPIVEYKSFTKNKAEVITSFHTNQQQLTDITAVITHIDSQKTSIYPNFKKGEKIKINITTEASSQKNKQATIGQIISSNDKESIIKTDSFLLKIADILPFPIGKNLNISIAAIANEVQEIKPSTSFVEINKSQENVFLATVKYINPQLPLKENVYNNLTKGSTVQLKINPPNQENKNIIIGQVINNTDKESVIKTDSFLFHFNQKLPFQMEKDLPLMIMTVNPKNNEPLITNTNPIKNELFNIFINNKDLFSGLLSFFHNPIAFQNTLKNLLLPQHNNKKLLSIIKKSTIIMPDKFSNWVDDKLIQSTVEYEGGKILKRATDLFQELFKTFYDERKYSIDIPFYLDATKQQVTFDIKKYTDNKEKGKKNCTFALQAFSNKLGAIQLAGVLEYIYDKLKSFSLTIYSKNLIDTKMQKDLFQIFSNYQKISGFNGRLKFETNAEFTL